MNPLSLCSNSSLAFCFSFLILGCTSCSYNVYTEWSDTETPEAFFFKAKEEINSKNFTQAISILEDLDPSFRLHRDRILVYASAYSGRCGLIFFDFLTKIQKLELGTPFKAFMSAFEGSSEDQVKDCIQAESIIFENIGDYRVRKKDENLYLGFNSMAKIGTILSAFADKNKDGKVDVGFSPCRDRNLPDSMVREIGTGFSITLKSLGSLNEKNLSPITEELNQFCELDVNFGFFCESQNEASKFTDVEVRFLRILIASKDFGIDACNGQNLQGCILTQATNCPSTP